MTGKVNPNFSTRLRAWRDAAAISRAELEDALTSAKRNPSSTGNYVAMLENGRHKPPDRDVCEVIAAKLGRTADEVWAASARARMAAAGVLDFHDEVSGCIAPVSPCRTERADIWEGVEGDLMEKARRHLASISDDQMTVEAAQAIIEWHREARLTQRDGGL